jgi:hypothetical protein
MGVVEALPLSSESAKRLLMKLSSTDSTMQASESCPARLSSYTYPLGQATSPFHFCPAMMKADLLHWCGSSVIDVGPELTHTSPQLFL